jgi:hypothetical protein
MRALDEGEWSASRPGLFNLGERALWDPLDRWLGGIQIRSESGVEDPCICRESNPGRPATC